MAAYEAFALGNVPGKVGSATERAQFRGGGIRIDEIPNLPKADMAMPLPNYPDVNIRQRYEYQKPVTGFEERAARLQQPELPGGFAKAAAITSAAAGEGEYRMGRAISEGAQGMADGLMQVADTLSKITREANDSKDSTDRIRYSNLENSYEVKFQADMTKENVPVQEWPERWQRDYAPQFTKDASGLGVTTATRDDIQARAVGFNDRMNLKWTLAGAQKQRQDDMDVSTAAFNDSLEHQNWQGASEANDNLYQHDYISKADHQANKWKIENAQNKQVLATQVSADPDYMLTQIDRIENPKEGKPPADPEFQWLKNDAVSRLQAKDEARQASLKRETDNERVFADKIASGEIKPENIDEEGQKMKIRPSEIKSQKKAAENEDPVYNPRVATRLNTGIDSYNWHDYPNEKDTLQRYHELKEQIRELPKSDRQDYENRLDQRLRDLRENKKQTLDEERVTSAKKYIDTLDDSGAFGPDGMKPDPDDKRKRILDAKDPAAVVQFREHYAKIEAMKNDVEQWMKDNPKSNLYDLQEHVGKLVNKYGVGAVQNLKPFTAQEYKAAGEPPKKGPTLQERADVERERAKMSVQPGNMPTPPSIMHTKPVSSFRDAKPVDGKQYPMAITAYTPGKGDRAMEGGNKVASRGGTAYTMEEYQGGTVPWVSVAMDSNSPLQGKFLKNDRYPNVVFKVEDTGSAFEGKGNSRIDIAFSDPSKGTGFSDSGNFSVISDADAKAIATDARAGGRVGATGGGGALRTVNPQLSSRFNAIEREWGQNLDVISGYRSVAYNAKVGGAPGSLHTHGNAIDVATGHLTRAEKLNLIRIAARNGITGFGIYANNLHFDLGKRRAWGDSYHSDSIPDWALPTLRQIGIV